VFVVHPRPPDLGLRIGMDNAKRDFDLGLVRGLIDADLAHGQDVMVLGDMNTTDREPAYDDISHGLRDSHLEAGIGPGLTWRPDDLRSVPIGLLRIDYVFATPDFSFQSSSVDCRVPSDHCRIDATLLLPGGS
jgi:endonuclease/exonuclease/phosphatase family metal-dependent hydrolase